MLGALAGGLVAELGIGPGPHLVVTALALGLVGLVVTRDLLPASADAVGARRAGPILARIPRAVLGLGVIGFCALLAEGSVSDWSAVYLDGTLDASPGIAAAGYAAFSLAMFGGRLLGDRLTDVLGPERIVRFGSLLAAGGLSLALAAPAPAVALLGFALTGAGLSIIVPVIFSAAGRAPGMPPGRGIAAVTTTGYLGFLVGPAIIGFLAGAATLRGALGFVVCLTLVMAALAGATRQADPAREEHESAMLGLPDAQ
jgi:fucose permease